MQLKVHVEVDVVALLRTRNISFEGNQRLSRRGWSCTEGWNIEKLKMYQLGVKYQKPLLRQLMVGDVPGFDSTQWFAVPQQIKWAQRKSTESSLKTRPSSHDIILSTVSIPYSHVVPTKQFLPLAPMLPNTRHRILWAEEQISEYQTLTKSRFCRIR